MIKFTAENPPSFARQEILTGDKHVAGLTMGYFLDLVNGDDRVDEGDYIAQDAAGNPIEIIRAAQALAQADRIALELGQDLKRTIRTSIKGMNLTAAEKVDLMDRILAVWVLLDDGDLQGARFKANNTATGGSYTIGRRNGLVALIDQAITQLP